MLIRVKEKRVKGYRFHAAPHTTENQMKQLGNHFNQDVLNKANEAVVIVCCYGKFMQSPYREKHIFQGTSRSKVFIPQLKDYFECQF